MKWRILIVLLLLISSFSYANGALTLSSDNIKTLNSKWYILSDTFNTYSSCLEIKNNYGRQYVDYSRSDCFYNSWTYKYFICKADEKCDISWIWTSENATNNDVSDAPKTTSVTSKENWTTAISNIPYKVKLDEFLTKIKSLKTELNNDSKYELLLNQLQTRLSQLEKKYYSNPDIKSMVKYLNTWVTQIKSDFKKVNEIDTFFCELTDWCKSEQKIEEPVKKPIVEPKETIKEPTIVNDEIQITSNTKILCWNPNWNSRIYYPDWSIVYLSLKECNKLWWKVWIKCNWKIVNLQSISNITNRNDFMCYENSWETLYDNGWAIYHNTWTTDDNSNSEEAVKDVPNTGIISPRTNDELLISSNITISCWNPEWKSITYYPDDNIVYLSLKECNNLWWKIWSKCNWSIVNLQNINYITNRNDFKCTTSSTTDPVNNWTTPNNSTPWVENTISLKSSNLVYCWNPDWNFYSSYPINWVVKISQNNCSKLWWKLWINCAWKKTNLTNLDSVLTWWYNFVCPVITPVINNTPTTDNPVASTCSWKYNFIFINDWEIFNNPAKTVCNSTMNWKSAYDRGQQIVATCYCWNSSTSNSSQMWWTISSKNPSFTQTEIDKAFNGLSFEDKSSKWLITLLNYKIVPTINSFRSKWFIITDEQIAKAFNNNWFPDVTTSSIYNYFINYQSKY